MTCVLLAGYMELRKWSRPHEFPFEGETFIWVPDTAEDRPFGRKRSEYGSFQYADGTPVSDHRLHRMLQSAWVERTQRAESGDNVT